MHNKYEIVEIDNNRISLNMLDKFKRTQIVEKRYREAEGIEQIENASFTDDWSTDERHEIIKYYFMDADDHSMYNAGIYSGRDLIAFVSLDCDPIGDEKEYIQLKMLHVSQEFRGEGFGKILFQHAVNKAKLMTVEKLYISAHSAYESQKFYRNQGCVPAKWIHPTSKKQEPYDIQMEYEL